MIFNSVPFFIFFVIIFFLYYFLNKNLKVQNWLLLLSSYVFYGYANWKIIPLLLVATTIIFLLGIAIHKSNNAKKSTALTTLGVLSGIGLLVYFKYFNFFIESFSSLFNTIGLKSNLGTFNIIMPLGISFFTFKLISYVIEINRGKIEPTKDFVNFSTYIAFFPTILSGPIDKPNTFIPQLQKKRTFDFGLAVDGCRQILWGLFQKVVIADNLAVIVNNVWSDIPNQNGTILFFALILYSFQLYTDFSGYSHMAIGVGKLLGFQITKNFNYPYFSRNISEFWRNWHMSLTTWLTDYVFMPLNIKFRNLGQLGIILAIVINMLAVGMWHGPNWTFIVFGLLHGLLYIPLILSGAFFKRKKLKTNNYGLPPLIDFSKMIGTYLMVTMTFILFRANNIEQAWEYFSGLFNLSIPSMVDLYAIGIASTILIIVFLAFSMFVAEWFYRNTDYPLAQLGLKWKRPLRYALYFAIIIVIFLFSGKDQQFIYFQF
jgi:alginate O-acetyltransferase complex protein AlgI